MPNQRRSSKYWNILKLLNEDKYLTDEHIYDFAEVVRSFDSGLRMRDTLMCQWMPHKLRPVDRNEKFVQIIYNQFQVAEDEDVRRRNREGTGHWTCIHYEPTWDGVGVIAVYNSIYQDQLYREQERVIDALFPGRRPRITFPEVSRQQNGYDCGVFAMAFATSVAFGRDPSRENYRREELRQHALCVLESQQLSLFPTVGSGYSYVDNRVGT